MHQITEWDPTQVPLYVPDAPIYRGGPRMGRAVEKDETKRPSDCQPPEARKRLIGP